jgi:hypothetical protein
MDPKPLHQLTDKELAERHRTYPRGIDPTYGANLGAEVERRQNQRNRRYALAAVAFAAISAFGSMIAAIASWAAIYFHAKP